MAFEFRLRAKYKRVEEAYERARDRFYDTDVARKTSHLITEGLYDMLQKTKACGRSSYTDPEQYASDLRAVEEMWKQTVCTHEARLKDHYDADSAFKEVRIEMWTLDKQLRDIESGRERWIKDGETEGPWRGGDPGDRYTVFYDSLTDTSSLREGIPASDAASLAAFFAATSAAEAEVSTTTSPPTIAFAAGRCIALLTTTPPL